MYKVSNLQHEQYGNVVHIERVEESSIDTPFFAWQQAIKSRRLWQESGTQKIRFLVDDQIMTAKQLEAWSVEEYKRLPKCEACAKILGGDVYTHRLCGHFLFCSQSCADKNYHQEVEKLKDEEDIDYY